jgi:hypothetical protein
LQRLDAQARALERTATGPTLEAHLAQERRRSHDHGGRSIFGWEPAPATAGSDDAQAGVAPRDQAAKRAVRQP